MAIKSLLEIGTSPHREQERERESEIIRDQFTVKRNRKIDITCGAIIKLPQFSFTSLFVSRKKSNFSLHYYLTYLV